MDNAIIRISPVFQQKNPQNQKDISSLLRPTRSPHLALLYR